MQRLKYVLLVVGLLVLSVFGWVTMAHAHTFKSSNTVTVPVGQTVDNTLFAAGRTVDIAGTVNGDLFCAGTNVTVSGQVNGDVLCAGQNLIVTGKVSGDVRLAGQNVTLGSQVGGNATIGATTFTQQSQSTVQGDMTIGSTNATLNGTVGRDVGGGNTDLTLSGTVGRNVKANVQHLKLENTAKVAGNITYASANTLTRASGAQVGGTVTRTTPVSHRGPAWTHLNGWLVALYFYVSFLVVALILALLLPGVLERAWIITRERLGMTFLVGLLSSILVPIVLTLLLATVIGIPLAIVAGLMWLVAVLLAGPFAAYLVGRWILRGSRNAVLVMLVGAAILFLVYLVPFVGWLIWLVGTWFGLGMILRLVGGIGRPRYETGDAAVTQGHVPKKAANA